MTTTNTTIDPVFISRTDSGFPAYLDFPALRTKAINYLGPITASFWTDYNIHDPGITTLEVLLYALMDLGYRVNFPIADLLTPDPRGGQGAVDFFTPAQVLGGNPYTINDYRKKLMDLTEVRNAWLSAGEADAAVAAGSGAGAAAGSGAGGVVVRGVYAVFLELEMDRSDFGTDSEWMAYRDKVVLQVKGVLQAHRNLCEDFGEPVVLSRKPVTVTADIELAEGVSPADVYRALVKALYTFFSPAPPYYTLGQLVQMGIPLDEVFAGRPYEKWPSHGFILDADLPERPTGRTPIYLSAVYHQILQVAGVTIVRQLGLNGEAGTGGTPGAPTAGTEPVWITATMDNALPVLDIAGSRFRWFRGGQLLAVDLGAETLSLQQEVIHGGKVFYPAGDLDVAIPRGRWLEGLSQYYSIQHDYPQVYGIGAGGLPPTASAERQAQALQFKGFLLFFDQLLADYLAQLGNIQTLFSMRGGSGSFDGPGGVAGGPGGASGGSGGPGIGAGGCSGGPANAPGGSTYFAGDVKDVPGLAPLLRFPAATGAGTMLVYPVDAAAWAAIAGAGPIACGALGTLSPFTFPAAADRDVALAQLALDFTVGSPTVSYIPVDGKQVVYVIAGIGDRFVLVSQSLFPDVAAASKEAATVLFIGAATENYHLSVLTAADGGPVYSFSLVQTGASYANYVQALLESPAQFTSRRTAFLQHLMERFAESFTDYALLSAGFLSPQEIAGRQVGLMERFLGDFPVLSGNRGQAFDYTQPSWGTGNISGLERRFLAYSGVASLRQDNRAPWAKVANEEGRGEAGPTEFSIWLQRELCNFEVEELQKAVEGAEAGPAGFVYRLTDKNHPLAFHPVQWKTADEAKAVRAVLIAKGIHGYRFPEICLGGDNIYFRENEGQWHFRVKCRNDYFISIGLPPGDDEWTMFESVEGYGSADAAQAAFQEQYLLILEKAMDPVNYGEGAFVGEVVFVPEDLRNAMTAAGLVVVDELVKAAKRYPIKRRGEFVFQLVNDETGETDWESAESFASAQDAHVAFDFFRGLLNVAGNYFIEFDEEQCGFRLGLREVLAESAGRFPDAVAAWGAVESFISVAQAAGSFHIEKRGDGSWGYFVAAADIHARHPCRYETEQQRDAALQQLFTAAKGFPVGGWFSGTDMVSLLDARTGTPVAQFASANKGVVDETLLNLVLDIADAVWAGQFFEDGLGLYVPAGGGAIRVRPMESGVGRDGWEDQLLQYFSAFPVVRSASEYRLELKLPGVGCFAAWVAPAPFAHAMDAWSAYSALLPLLGELSNHRAVFLGPGVHGIELYLPGDILAVNPQTYVYPEMAMRGIDRARACINIEGLHLVEHLLLRPEKGVKTAIPGCPPAAPLSGFTIQPGVDGYSFIITAFLPAWPERYRKAENRQILVRRLQEEAPAHILLRILWLTPMDMCRWEGLYRDWLRSLRPEKPCMDYSADEWVKTLFAGPIQCLAEPVAEVAKHSDADEWLSEVNLNYCWKDRDCADTSKWTFDVPKTGSTGGGISFKPSPNPTGQTVGSAKVVTGGKGLAGELQSVESGVVKGVENVVDKVKGVADKAEDMVNKVQGATDTVHDVSDKLKDVENIAKDVIPFVIEEIPVVGPVIGAAEKVAVRIGLWTKILKKGVDVLEGLLTRLKGILEKGEKK